jgi:hypothetical protein
VIAALAAAAALAAGAPSSQTLRTCVDRWNADNMVSWRSLSVLVAVRALDARERAAVSFGDDARRRCTVSLAARAGDNTWICRMGPSGGYECPLITSDGMPALRHPNGRTDAHGVLRLRVPLSGTHPPPPLPWQRRYPHVDGYILPWTRGGTLRPGLRLVGQHRGACGRFVEHPLPPTAIRCVDRRTGSYSEPCFAQRATVRVGDLAVCGGTGDTTFERWLITSRLP